MAQRNLKEQLVDGASRVLFEKGFHATSVNDIVAAAGVPKGSFYNHFESKEALALEVTRRYCASQGIERLATDDGPPLERLRSHFETMGGRAAARGVDHGCLLGNFSTEMARHSPAIRAFVSATLDSWSAAVATVLGQAQAAGQLSQELDVQALGCYLVDAYEGSVARAKVSGDRAPLDAFITTTFGTVLAV